MQQNKFIRLVIFSATLALAIGTGFNAYAAAKKKTAPPKTAPAPAPQSVIGIVEKVNIKTDSIQFKVTDKTYTCRVAADAQIVTLTNPVASLGDLKAGDSVKVKISVEMGKTVTHKIEQTKAAPTSAEEPTPAK